jgi:hypothetical protein
MVRPWAGQGHKPWISTDARPPHRARCLREGPPLTRPPRGDPAPRLNPPKQFSGAETPRRSRRTGRFSEAAPPSCPGRFTVSVPSRRAQRQPVRVPVARSRRGRLPTQCRVAAPHAADLDSRSHAASTFAFDAGRVHHSRPSNVVGHRSATVASIASLLAAISCFTWSVSSEVMAVGSS